MLFEILVNGFYVTLASIFNIDQNVIEVYNDKKDNFFY